ncbi:MAG: TIGR00730 family Rossman fold protein [Sphaerochaetaceae bacterium]|nr:TIGR00730 family Rossman fold protein [Sphaerochaetaceae bacterium]
MKKLQTLAVFCGSSTGTNPRLAEGAKELGIAMAEKHLSLVYGGGNRGLMGIVAQSLYERGGNVIGVLPEALNRKDVRLHTVENELIIVPTMHERKAKMYSLADAFIALPGGIGTLEEILEIFTWLQLGYHQKPVAILNLAGFYDQLLDFLSYSVQQGFLKQDHLNALIVDQDIDSLLEKLEEWEPKLSDKLSP